MQLRHIANEIVGLIADRDLFRKLESEIVANNPQLSGVRNPVLEMLRGCYADSMSARALRLLINDGNLALLKLMLAPPSAAHQMMLDRHVDYVVICQTEPNQSIIRRAPEGLEATLARGEAPDFLERIDIASAGKIATWRLRK